MKVLAIMLAAVMTTSLACTQKVGDKEVPVTVKTAFQEQYPNIKKVKWEKEKENYEAAFEIEETDCSVLFDVSGNIVETEIEISVNELPSNVRDYISKNYARQKIKEAAKITDAKGKLTYEAEIKGKDLIFDSNGNFIEN